MFSMLQKAKRRFNLEDYSLSQVSLERVSLLGECVCARVPVCPCALSQTTAHTLPLCALFARRCFCTLQRSSTMGLKSGMASQHPAAAAAAAGTARRRARASLAARSKAQSCEKNTCHIAERVLTNVCMATLPSRLPLVDSSAPQLPLSVSLVLWFSCFVCF